MRTKFLQLLVVLLTASPSILALGHHSTNDFDRDTVLEFAGEVVRVQWYNPHVRMQIRVETDNGASEIWDMEAMDVNSLDRAGVPRDLVEVGQTVTIAGTPSSRRPRALLLTNLMLPDGRELLTHVSGVPRWSEEAIGDRTAVRGRAEEFIAPVDDIYRVWTTAQTNTPDIPEPPLTPAARAAYEDFDPLVDDPVLSCVAPGMPEAMTWIGPHPVEFVSAANGDIQIHVESDDVVRIVRMTADANTQGPPPSPLGYSVGRWEGDTLVVTTTRIDWPYFKIRGLVGAPQSDRIEIVERFELDRARGELTYNFTATDPVNYTRPITVERYHVWRYRLGTAINPYRCTL